MTNPITYINNGDPVDANPLMQLITDLYSKFPVTGSNYGSPIPGTYIDWTGVTIPSSSIPNINPIPGNGNSQIDSDPLSTLALGYNFVRRNSTTLNWQFYSGNARHVSLVNNGFMFCAGDAVIELSRNSLGGAADTLQNVIPHNGAVGDAPIHAIATGTRLGYAVLSGVTPIQIKTFTVGASSSLQSFLTLGAGYTNPDKITTDRTGQYLYISCKSTATTNRSAVVQVNVSTLAVAELDFGTGANDGDIVDIACIYGRDARLDIYEVFVAQKNTAAGGVGKVWYAPGPSNWAGGTPIAALTKGATVKVMGLCNWHGKVSVISYDSGGTVDWDVITYDGDTSTGASNGIATLYSLTGIATVPVPLTGATCSDGYNVYAMRDDGRIMIFNVNGTGATVLMPAFQCGAAAGTYESPSGIVYCGKSVCGVFREVGTADGHLFMF